MRKSVIFIMFGVLAVLGIGVACIRLTHPLPPAPDEVVVEEAPPELWVTDGAGDDAGVIARPMPAKPFKEQKTPPCRGKGEVVVNDGCWVALETKPEPGVGCGPSYFEKNGKCYLPVQKPKPPPPTSLEP